MPEYMISYQLYPEHCGNRCGSAAEVLEYFNQNRHRWKSYSFFRIGKTYGILSDLHLIPESEVV